jgi:hypothetical protein
LLIDHFEHAFHLGGGGETRKTDKYDSRSRLTLEEYQLREVFVIVRRIRLWSAERARTTGSVEPS